MTTFKYDENKFDKYSRKIIGIMIRENTNKEILDLATQVNNKGKQVFSDDELEVILRGVKNKLSIEEISFYAVNNNGKSLYNHIQMEAIRSVFRNGFTINEASILTKLNNKGEPVYNAGQMDVISWALEENIPKDDIVLLIKLDENMKPIYNASQMFEFYEGAKLTPIPEAIKLYGKLNEKGHPIYDDGQMYQFRLGLQSGLPVEHIMIYAQLKNNKPIFNNVEMDNIRNFIEHANNNQIKQIEKCINKNLTYEQLDPLLKNIPAENIRILSSFYDFECKPTSVKILADKNYKDLKEIKYIFQCAYASFIDVNNIANTAFDSVEEMRKEIASLICIKNDITNLDINDIIHRCMEYKMPPEQINFIANKEFSFSVEEMKAVAAGFLNGLSSKEMKHSARVLFANGREIRLFNKEIESIIMNKFNIDTYLNENVKLQSEYFDENIDIEF